MTKSKFEADRRTPLGMMAAGMAGASAARTLAAADRKVLVLEARDRVGGRTKPGEIAGMKIDLGGMWLGPTQTRLAAMAQHYGVETYPTYLAGQSITNGRRSDPAANPAVGEAIVRLTEMSLAVPPEAPWTAPEAAAWDAMTVESWILANVADPAAQATLRLVVRALLCADPGQVSLLYFLFYARSGEGIATLISSDTGGAQNLLFRGGLHQISVAMARDLGDRVRLDEPVTLVSQDASGVTVTTTKGQYRAARAIVAMSPPMAGRLAYEPPLPHARDAMTQRMPMGSVIKAWVAYETPFWRAKGLNGSVAGATDGFNLCFDVSPPGQPRGYLAGFFDAGEATLWAARTKDERRAEVLRFVSANLGPEGNSPIAYVENDWTAEIWSRGCYGAFAPPGVLSLFGHALRAPVGRLHWAGAETATAWSGYVDGAIQSGERAAKEVLGA